MFISREGFGKDFSWGVSTAAFQIEGATQKHGKGLSIWDDFTQKNNKIRNNQNANIACDYYHKYPEDIYHIKELSIPNYRFSISWARIMPNGTGQINLQGIDYYKRVIDYCVELGIEPWITLYHWDLPLELHKKGIKCFVILPEMKVSEVESSFWEKMGIQISVFRKSGKTWLESSFTNYWSLERQNNLGKGMNDFLKVEPQKVIK